MSAYIPVELRRRIRALFANCCAYCRTSETLTVTIFEIEHIIPRSAGGETVHGNLCLACPMCNRFKADRQTVPDPVTQHAVPVFHPQRQKWQEHFAWSEDATEINGLTPIGRATIAALKMNRSQLIRLRRLWVKMGEHGSQVD
jgi:hypothetical protein